MSGKFAIIDPKTNASADLHVASGDHIDKTGLVVFTHSLEERINVVSFLTNETLGNDLVNFSQTVGSNTLIHDGGDNTAFTGTAVNGTWDFASATQAQSGTASIDGSSTTTGDIADLINGSTLNLGDYNQLVGYIYIDRWPNPGQTDLQLSFLNAGVPVGTSVNIFDFVDDTNIDTWQLFTIPIGDFGGGTFDTLRLFRASGTNTFDFYLDGLNLSSSSSTATFQYQPELDEIVDVDVVRLAVRGSGTELDAGKFFNLNALGSGLRIQYLNEGTVSESFLFKNVFDLMQRAAVDLKVFPDAASNTFMAIADVGFVPGSFIVNGLDSDSIRVLISDDVSSLTSAVISLQGSSKQIN